MDIILFLDSVQRKLRVPSSGIVVWVLRLYKYFFKKIKNNKIKKSEENEGIPEIQKLYLNLESKHLTPIACPLQDSV